MSPEFPRVPVARQAVQPYVFLPDVLVTGLGKRDERGWNLLADLLPTIGMALGPESHRPHLPVRKLLQLGPAVSQILQRLFLCTLLRAAT